MNLYCFSWEGPLVSAKAIVCDETLEKAKKTLFQYLSEHRPLSNREKKAGSVNAVDLYIKNDTDVSKSGVIAYYDGGD